MKTGSHKLIQVTDSHLFETEAGKLLGMNTQFSLLAVLDLIRAEQPTFDLILATGDLAQDGSVSAYQYLRDQLAGFNCPQYWLPGNHDNRDNMLRVVSTATEMRPVIDLGNWQIIMLDSQVVGSVHGRFAQSQLDLLEQALKAAPDKHSLICMHHHPLPAGCKWLDTQQIKNSAEFLQLIKAHANVKAVLWGHVHQDRNELIDGVRYMSTPSTCVQFEPHSNDFAVDKEAPGYRVLTLNPDGSVDSLVSRVNDIEFEIDYTIKGY